METGGSSSFKEGRGRRTMDCSFLFGRVGSSGFSGLNLNPSGSAGFLAANGVDLGAIFLELRSAFWGGVVRLLSLLSGAGLTLFSFLMTSFCSGKGKKITGIGRDFCFNFDELAHVNRNTRCRHKEMRKKWTMDDR